MPKMTFVMPTYNRLEWLGESMQSLLTQTEHDIEIIIVDDGSTDGSREWLKEYEENKLAPLFPYDKRVKIIYNEVNKGAGPSRNIGADASTSEIIGVCDSDDLNTNERAALTIKHFQDNPESELVNYGYLSIGHYNEKIEEFKGEPFNHEACLKGEGFNYYCNPSAAYKKKSAQEIGGFERETDTVTDDAQFISKWVKAGKRVHYQPGYYIIFHRNLPDSMMTKTRGYNPKWSEKK